MGLNQRHRILFESAAWDFDWVRHTKILEKSVVSITKTAIPMKALLYISEAKVAFSPDDLTELAVRSAIKNGRLGITGYLYYEKGLFLQYIEGEGEELEMLYCTIASDARHRVTGFITEDLDRRRFPNWSMKNISEVMGENSTIEQTVIQTIRLFDQNQMNIPEGTKIGLFRFMDDLAQIHAELH